MLFRTSLAMLLNDRTMDCCPEERVNRIRELLRDRGPSFGFVLVCTNLGQQSFHTAVSREGIESVLAEQMSKTPNMGWQVFETCGQPDFKINRTVTAKLED